MSKITEIVFTTKVATVLVNLRLKPMMISRMPKEESQICRKVSNGKFECPSKEPASIVLAIPWYPDAHPSLLINPSGEFCKNRPIPDLVSQKCKKMHISDLSTRIATFDNTGLRGHHLKYGCPVFYQNELLVFGVHESDPKYSSVS